MVLKMTNTVQKVDLEWEKTKEYIYDRIDHKKEFQVLNLAYKNKFKNEHEYMSFVNYCLDWYNYYIYKGWPKKEAKFKALTKTLHEISIADQTLEYKLEKNEEW